MKNMSLGSRTPTVPPPTLFPQPIGVNIIYPSLVVHMGLGYQRSLGLKLKRLEIREMEEG